MDSNDSESPLQEVHGEKKANLVENVVDLSLLDQTIEFLNIGYDCREKFGNFFFTNSEGEKAPFRCGCWNCRCCAWRMRCNLVREVSRLGNEREMCRFLTLTLDPSKIQGDSFKFLMKMWNKFRIYLQRKFGQVDFVWVVEKQENGNPHLHIILGDFIPIKWIEKTWENIRAGKIVYIEYVDPQRIGNYLGKYLTKKAVMDLPKGTHRYGYSQGITLAVRYRKQTDDDTWMLMVETVEELPQGQAKIIRQIRRFDFVDPPPPP